MTEKRRPRRGVFLLPTCFTVGNMFCGFFGLVESARGQFASAGLLIIVAAVLDGLDGRIARLTGTTSEFGLEFDSLADVVSFGVTPAFLTYRWALVPFHRTGWLIAFLYLVCAATRLARFNLRHGLADKRYFIGLPSPPAAAAVATVAFAFPSPPENRMVASGLAALTTVAALLMVSRFRYRSFKDLDLRNRRSYLVVVLIAVALVAVFTHPKGALLTLAAVYLVSAPAAYLLGLVWHARGRGSDASGDAGEVVEAKDA
jgi:CDP-diacylglycerol---serine O-phosphatidyltransferase